jgi:hypothetical protein
MKEEGKAKLCCLFSGRIENKLNFCQPSSEHSSKEGTEHRTMQYTDTYFITPNNKPGAGQNVENKIWMLQNVDKDKMWMTKIWKI